MALPGPPHISLLRCGRDAEVPPFMGGWLTSEIWVPHLRDAFIVAKILSRFASFL